MSATERLLKWSASLPAWQQDALRRLAANRSLSDQDKVDLLAMLKAEHGLVPLDKAPKSVPLADEHLPDTAFHGDELALSAISDVQNAMRLKPGETLDFALTGLTLVYGDNGSGKSGYARILKRAARARGQETEVVLPNVFDENYESAPPATAKICVSVTRDGKAKEHVLDWEEGQPSPDLLARVRVFDNRQAAVYVNDRSEVAFVPFNLDLLELLARTCDRLRTQVEWEKDQLQVRCNELAASIPDAGTARIFVENLSAKTKPEEVAKATKWNEDPDGARLKELERSLTDPAAQVIALRQRKVRCESLRRRVLKIETALTGEQAQQLETLFKDAINKREATNKLSQEAFNQEPLAGVGGGPWRVLWDAAQDYSIQAAYTGQAFPVLDTDDPRCVLCQQPIGPEAKERLARFRRFMEGEVARQAYTAEKALSEARSQLEGIEIKLTDDDEVLVEEIETEDKKLAQLLTVFFETAEKRKGALVEALGTGDFSKSGKAPAQRSASLLAHAADFEHRATELEGALTPEERTKLQGKHAQLLGRKTLAEHKATVERLVAHRATVKKLEACRNVLGTQQITNTKKALEKQFLMNPFRDALQEELDALGIAQQVTLGFTGEKAVTYQKAHFRGTNFEQLEDVLSEGEHRAVALACFFSEARQLPGASPLVVDDPTSSLDHIRRERVARRLVEEAKQRQVIVLTHDLMLYTDLVAKAAEHQVPLRRRSLMRVQEGYGHVDESGVPWPAKGVAERLELLEKERLPELRPLYEANDPSYPDRVRAFGEMLRETWERLVEEGLFNNVVIRFRPSVETLRLREVTVEDSEWLEIHWGMTRTSKWAHDQPAATGTPPPTPDELREEIEKIRTCRATMKQVRQKVAKRRKKLVEPPST